MAVAVPVKAVLRQTAVDVPTIGACLRGASFVGMTVNAVLIVSYKHHIVVFLRFIYHPFVCKDIDNGFVDASHLYGVAVDPPHGFVCLRQFKGLSFLIWETCF